MATADGEPLTPEHARPGTPPRRAGPLDHAWLDNGHGVLSCVAGRRHAPNAIAACPYYLRHDVAAGLPAPFRPTIRSLAPLVLHDGPYHKITALAPPARWRDLVASLPGHHGLRPCAWSTISAIEPDRVRTTVDPRDAFAAALRASDRGPSAALLARLAAAMGDAGNVAGTLGLTGSAALSPSKLAPDRDADLLVYLDTGSEGRLQEALGSLGAVSLGALPADDPRLAGYGGSRTMPAVAVPATQGALRSRRRDVAWVGAQRLDLTLAAPDGDPVDALDFDRAPLARFDGEVTIASVSDRYPVILGVDQTELAGVIVTARGFQSSFWRGDRVALYGHLHRGRDGQPFVSIDDCAGHQVELREDQ
jgi:hypothetical protein